MTLDQFSSVIVADIQAHIVSDIQAQIDELEARNYTIIDGCNCVVVSKCGLYTIGRIGEFAKVDIGNIFPSQFTMEQAKHLLEFPASNGKGAIEWQIVSAEYFRKKQLSELKQVLSDINHETV